MVLCKISSLKNFLKLSLFLVIPAYEPESRFYCHCELLEEAKQSHELIAIIHNLLFGVILGKTIK